MTDLSLWHMTPSGARQHTLTGWSDKETGTWLAAASAVVDDVYVWVTAEGSVHAAPVDGGNVSDLKDLHLPQPLPADTVLRFSDDGLLMVSLPSQQGLELRTYAFDGDGWSSREATTLRARVPDGQYVSDVIVND